MERLEIYRRRVGTLVLSLMMIAALLNVPGNILVAHATQYNNVQMTYNFSESGNFTSISISFNITDASAAVAAGNWGVGIFECDFSDSNEAKSEALSTYGLADISTYCKPGTYSYNQFSAARTAPYDWTVEQVCTTKYTDDNRALLSLPVAYSAGASAWNAGSQNGISATLDFSGVQLEAGKNYYAQIMMNNGKCWFVESSGTKGYTGNTFTLSDIHTHSLVYGTEGTDKLSVYCSQTKGGNYCKCQGESGKLYMTLAAQDSVDGTPATVSLGTQAEKTKWTEAGIDSPTLTYYETNTKGSTSGGSLLNTAPSKAGYYYVTASIGGKSIAIPYTIRKMKLTSVTEPEISTPLEKFTTEDEQIKALPTSVAVEVEDKAVSSMKIQWSLKEGTTYDDTSEGENTFVWSIVPSEYENYDTNGKTLSGEVTIKNPKHNHTWVYDADGSELRVWCSQGGTHGCQYTEDNCMTLELAAGTPIYDGDKISYSEDGTDADVTLNGKDQLQDAGIEVSQVVFKGRGDTSYDSSNECPVHAGAYTASVSASDETISVDFQIQRRNVTVIIDDVEKFVGDEDPELTYMVDGLVGDDTLTGIKLEREAGEKPGNYCITASIDADADYDYNITVEGDGVFTILAILEDSCSGGPETGDDMNSIAPLVAMLLALAGIVAVVFTGKRIR